MSSYIANRKFKTYVAWRTIASNVYQLTRTDGIEGSTYRITVKAIDTNNIEADDSDVGYYFTDYIGTPYPIIATGSGTIDVKDDFLTGLCPTVGRNGIVHKSAYKGYSIALPAEMFTHLAPIARDNNRKYQMAILWNNDPNPLRYEFPSTNDPRITNYQSQQPDGHWLSDDYGDKPKCRLMRIDYTDPNMLIEYTNPPYYYYVGGELDSIGFGILDEVADWIIEISR